jgi:hypothetical protein
MKARTKFIGIVSAFVILETVNLIGCTAASVTIIPETIKYAYSSQSRIIISSRVIQITGDAPALMIESGKESAYPDSMRDRRIDIYQ